MPNWHILALFLLSINAASSDDASCEKSGRADDCSVGRSWRAAVVEYGPPKYDGGNSNKYIRGILSEYEEMVREAKKNGADIIVFPEYGLSKPNVLRGATGPKDILMFVQELPRMEDWNRDKAFRTVT